MYEDAHLEEAYELSQTGGLVEEPSFEERDEMLDEVEMLKAEMEAEARMAYYDDDPSPYDGTYSEC